MPSLKASPKPTSPASPSVSRAPKPARRRLTPADREQQIVQNAITVFSQIGFGASTRELASALGVTQPLLYRYFATKDELIERVYDEVIFRPWNTEWETWLADGTTSLGDRLRRYLNDYVHFITRSSLVRLQMYAALAGVAGNAQLHRFIENLRERHFKVIARELRFEYGIPDPIGPEEEADEIELVWSAHSTVYYMGVRQWIYGLPPPANIERTIDLLVDGFLMGAPAVLKRQREGR